jgi:hypothetical protein
MPWPTTARRTVVDFVPGYEATAWNGIGASRNTPVEIIDQAQQSDQPGPLADPKMQARRVDRCM